MSARVAVVIPAYQASRSVGAVIRSVPASVATIVVVDDASTDGTSDAARAAGDERVQVLRRDVNGGVGAAMIDGYREALAAGADVVVKMDADGQMDPAHLPALLEPILSGRADYAKGNRFWTTAHLEGMPAVRAVGNAGLSFFAKLSSGAWHVFDPNNGYTAIHRAALESVDWRRIHPRYFFETSMLAVLGVARAVIEDVPMGAVYRGETSHLSLRRALVEFPLLHARYAAWRLVKRYLVRDFNACSLLLVAGLPVFLFGAVAGAAVWIRSAKTGTYASTGTVMIPTLALIVGFQMLLQALVLDVGDAPRAPLQARAARGGGTIA